MTVVAFVPARVAPHHGTAYGVATLPMSGGTVGAVAAARRIHQLGEATPIHLSAIVPGPNTKVPAGDAKVPAGGAKVPVGDEHNHALESRRAGRLRRTA